MEPSAAWTPAGSGSPNAARVCDWFLGGKDNFAADRDLGAALADACPELRVLARAGRSFVLNAARWCAAVKGTGQFLDLGCGLPARPAVHDEARAGRQDARVIYIDKDPMVISHMAALQSGPGLAAGRADAADPERVLEAVGDLHLIDFAQPAAVILGGTLSTLGAPAARTAVAGYAGALAPGSAVVISCVSCGDETLGKRIAGLYSAAEPGWQNHSYEDAESFFLAAGLRVAHGRVADVRWLSRELATEMLCRGGYTPRQAERPEWSRAAVIGGVGIVG